MVVKSKFKFYENLILATNPAAKCFGHELIREKILNHLQPRNVAQLEQVSTCFRSELLEPSVDRTFWRKHYDAQYGNNGFFLNNIFKIIIHLKISMGSRLTGHNTIEGSYNSETGSDSPIDIHRLFMHSFHADVHTNQNQIQWHPSIQVQDDLPDRTRTFRTQGVPFYQHHSIQIDRSRSHTTHLDRHLDRSRSPIILCNLQIQAEVVHSLHCSAISINQIGFLVTIPLETLRTRYPEIVS